MNGCDEGRYYLVCDHEKFQENKCSTNIFEFRSDSESQFGNYPTLHILYHF